MNFTIQNADGGTLTIDVTSNEIQRLEGELAKLRQRHEKITDELFSAAIGRLKRLRQYASLLEGKLSRQDIDGILSGDVQMRLTLESDDAKALREWLV